MENNKVIPFKNKNVIEFIDLLDDPQIKVICFTILEELGYQVSPKGVKDFQIKTGIEPTGIIDGATFIYLAENLDIDYKIPLLLKVQELQKSKEEKGKKIATPIVILWLLGFVITEIFGVIYIYKLLLGLFK